MNGVKRSGVVTSESVRGKGTFRKVSSRPTSHVRAIDNGTAAKKKAKSSWADSGGENQEGFEGKWAKEAETWPPLLIFFVAKVKY
jgi:hypothetical protein